MLNKRVEVLFDEAEYRRLQKLARKENTSVGALIREAVRKLPKEAPSDARRREAVEWLTSQNFDFIGDWDEVKKDISDSLYEQIEESLEAR